MKIPFICTVFGFKHDYDKLVTLKTGLKPYRHTKMYRTCKRCGKKKSVWV